jgi:undecaprenyl pyrophosphate phosphatase UppP
VLIYFRRDIVGILGAWTVSLYRSERRKDPQARMGWFIIIGTFPIGVLGVLLQDTIETVFRDLRLIGVTLVLFGLVLAVAEPGRPQHQALVRAVGKPRPRLRLRAGARDHSRGFTFRWHHQCRAIARISA